jgi:ADP-ribosyl-[dinitrogen reductase] hydrolase
MDVPKTTISIPVQRIAPWHIGQGSVNGRCFDIGITTRSALGNYVAKEDALTSGDRSDRASGNGSIMRLAPVPIRFGHLYADQLNDIKPLHPLIHEIAQGSFRRKQPPAIQGSGWVVKSLEASLWAFRNAESFEDAVLKAVNLGDDADTTEAICGQLAGAYWGESGISESLRTGLARMDMLEDALAKIFSDQGSI